MSEECTISKKGNLEELKSNIKGIRFRLILAKDFKSRETILDNSITDFSKKYCTSDDLNTRKAEFDTIRNCFKEILNTRRLDGLEDIVDQILDRLQNEEPSSVEPVALPDSNEITDTPTIKEKKKVGERNPITESFNDYEQLLKSALLEADRKLKGCILYDVGDGTMVTNVDTLNKKIKLYLNDLFEIVRDYVDSDLNYTLNDADKATLYSNRSLYDAELNYNNNWPEVFRVFECYIGGKNYSKSALIKYYNSSNLVDKKFIAAYKAFAILKNFDRIVKNSLGNGIKIKRISLNRFTSDNDKYQINKVANNGRNYNEKEISLLDTMDNIVKLIIRTTPLYLYGNDIPVPDRYLEPRNDEAVKGFIKDLAKTDFGNKDLSDIGELSTEDLAYLRDRDITTYRLLVNKFDTNIMYYGKCIFKILSTLSEDTINTYKNSIKEFKNSNLLNAVYSIYKEIFADENSLLSIINNNPDIKENYYLYYVHTLLYSTPREYTETIINEDGDIKMVDVSSKRSSESKNSVTRNINATLGNGNDINYKKINNEYTITISKDGKIATINLGFPGCEIYCDLKKIRSNFDISKELKNALNTNSKEGSKYRQIILQYCQKILGTNFIIKTDTGDFLETEYAKAWFNNYINSEKLGVIQLAYLASNIYINSYFTHEVLNKESLDGKDKIIRTGSNIRKALHSFYCKETKLCSRMDGKSNDISLIGSAFNPTLQIYADSLDTVNNVSSKGVLGTEDGSTVSKYSIVSLSDSLSGRIETLFNNEDEDNPYNGMHILKLGFFNGIAFEKDAAVGSLPKPQENWTPAEDFTQSFLYEFLENFYSTDSKDVYFYLDDISDKTNRVLVKSDLKNYEIRIGDKIKRLNELNQLELREVIRGELDKFYSKILNNIDNKYITLNKFILKHPELFPELNNSLYKDGFNKFYGCINYLESLFTREPDLFKDILDERAANSNYNPKEAFERWVTLKYGNIYNFVAESGNLFNEKMKKAFYVFNVYDNFKSFSIHTSNLNSVKNISPILEFSNIIKIYNRYVTDHPNEGKLLEFTRNVDYQIVGNKPPKLVFSRLLMALVSRCKVTIEPKLQLFWDELKISSPGISYTNNKDYWEIKNLEIIDDYLRTGTRIDLNSPLKENEIARTKLLENNDWVTDDKEFVIARLTNKEDKSVIKVSKLSDLSYYIDEDSNKVVPSLNNLDSIRQIYIRDKNFHSYLDSEFDIGNLEGYSIEINPEVEKFNLFDTLVTLEVMFAGMGSPLYFDTKKNKWSGSDLKEEAASINDEHKRNSMLTATEKKFSVGTLLGIPEVYNIADIEDVKSLVFTLDGTKETIKPYDGATFVNAFVNYLENKSLGGSAAGFIKKPVGLAIDTNTAGGRIIKTATFPITNSIMRDSLFYRNLMRKTSDIRWRNEDRSEFNGDITKWLFYDPKEKKPEEKKFVEKNINYSGFFKTRTSIFEIVSLKPTETPGRYERVVRDVKTNKEYSSMQEIRSNYQLWLALGGYDSVEISNGEYIPSESSIEKVVDVMNKVGTVRLEMNFETGEMEDVFIPKNCPITQELIYQPLKHSDIHYVVTEGAKKVGITNINSKECYKNSEELNYGHIYTYNIGILLDPEHDVDMKKVALMTLVVSALASLGYTEEVAQRAYQTLAKLTTNAAREVLDNRLAYEKNVADGSDPEAIRKTKEELSVAIAKGILNGISDNKRDDVVRYIVSDLLEKLKKSGNITYDDIKNSMPYSDSSLFNFLISTTSSAINRLSFKLKMFGGLDVLSPSDGIMLTFHGKMLSEYTSVEDIINEQQLMDKTPITKRNQLDLGHWYEIDGKVVLIEDPDDYWKYGVDEYFLNGKTIREILYTTKDIENSETIENSPLYNDFVTEEGQEDLSTELGLLKFKQWLYKNLLGKTIQYTTNDNLVKSMTINTRNDLVSDFIDTSKVNSGGIIDRLFSNEKNKITNIKIFTLLGNELGCYGIRFVGIDKDGNERDYNTWDLDSIKRKWKLKKGLLRVDEEIKKLSSLDASITELSNELQKSIGEVLNIDNIKLDNQLSIASLLSLLEGLKKSWQIEYKDKSQRDLLFDLLNLSKHVHNPKFLDENGNYTLRNTVYIDGQPITIKRGSVKEQLYGIIIPYYYKEIFGINEFDNLSNIKNDKHFFLRKQLDKLISSERTKNFDILLLRTGKDDLLLMDSKLFFDKDHPDFKEEELEKRNINGRLFRIDSDGNKIHLLANKNDKLYITLGGKEVIVTDNINFYLRNFKYSTINISPELDKKVKEQKARPNYIDEFFVGVRGYSKESIYLEGFLKQAKALKSLIDSGKDVDINIYSSKLRELYRKSIKIHTSFLKSLEMVAARIPAQSLLSFMGMEIKGFLKLTTNAAYVSKWQIFLQGSDYDVDKVTLLNSCFGRDGVYEDWSFYFNYDSLELFHACEQYPYPNGFKSKVLRLSEEQLKDRRLNKVSELLNKYKEALNEIKVFKSKEELNKLTDVHKVNPRNYLNISTPSEILELSKFLDVINDYSDRIKNELNGVEGFEDYINSTILPESEELEDSALSRIVDGHNLYTTDKDEENSLKNNLVSNILETSKDPANLLEAMASTDGVALPLKDIAEKSIFGKKDARNGLGNFFSKLLAKFNNMLGKDSIAICASLGLKSFYAITLFFNHILKTDPEKAKTLLFHNDILDGKDEYKIFLNSWIENPEVYKSDENSSDIEKKLDKAVQEAYRNLSNFALILSGEMTLSADNAKNPVLSKLNSGPDTFGMYLYAIIRGLDFGFTSNIMTSNVAKAISDLTRNNVFIEDSNIPFNGVLNFLKNPIRGCLGHYSYVQAIKSIMGKDYSKLGSFKLVDSFLKSATDEMKDFYSGHLNDVDYAPTPTVIKKLLIMDEINKMTPELININRDRLQKWVDTMKIIIKDLIISEKHGLPSTLDLFTELYKGANELKLLSSFLGLNQGLKVGLKDNLEFLYKIKRVFKSANKDSKTYLDFERFVKDSSYREEMISKYNELKHTFNILDILWNVPNYRAYLLELERSIFELKESVIFKKLYEEYGVLKEFHLARSENESSKLVKNAQSFLQSELINDWLRTEPLFILPRGAKVYDKQGNSKELTENARILLGTDEGNLAFVEWMNTKIIPDIKLLKLRDGEEWVPMSSLAGNKFLDGLNQTRNTFNISKKQTIQYTLRGDLMGTSDDSIAVIEKMAEEFNRLLNFLYKYSKDLAYDLKNLFIYYNFIVYKRSNTKDSFTKILKQFEPDTDIYERYKTYISRQDREGELNFDDTELLYTTAPEVSNIWRIPRKYKLFKWWDSEDLKYKYYKLKEKEDTGKETSSDEDVNDVEDVERQEEYEQLLLDSISDGITDEETFNELDGYSDEDYGDASEADVYGEDYGEGSTKDYRNARNEKIKDYLKNKGYEELEFGAIKSGIVFRDRIGTTIKNNFQNNDIKLDAIRVNGGIYSEGFDVKVSPEGKIESITYQGGQYDALNELVGLDFPSTNIILGNNATRVADISELKLKLDFDKNEKNCNG